MASKVFPNSVPPPTTKQGVELRGARGAHVNFQLAIRPSNGVVNVSASVESDGVFSFTAKLVDFVPVKVPANWPQRKLVR